MHIDELRSPLLRVLVERGFVKDCTDLAGLDREMAAGVVPAYVGFDLTAPSLHVGSGIPLMAARHMRRAAVESGLHTLGGAIDAVHVLFGDATTRVGDPSDKNGARPILTGEAIDANLIGIRSCIDRFVGDAMREHHNSAWLDGLSFMDFLTGPAREISLNRLVATDVVSRRLENQLPMTLMELIYQAMQAMDFAHLAKNHGVRLQIGGSDQWSNIIAGVDLARRMHDIPVFGMTMPLLTDAEGRKMGKTAGGKTIWLDPSRTSSFDLWQFWRNVPDAKVGEFLGLFTDIPMDEVRMWGASEGSAINEAKTILATEAVAIAHGREAAEGAAEAAKASSKRGVMDDAAALASLPTVECPVNPDTTVITVAEAMVLAGVADSKAAARRLAAQGGFRINGVRIEHVDLPIEERDFSDGHMILSAGRRKHVRMTPWRLGPSLRPVSARVVEENGGTFGVIGSYDWGDDGTVEDDIARGLPDRAAAEERLKRVRTASPR